MNRAGLGFKILVGLALVSICAICGLTLVLRLYLADVFEAKLIKRGVSIARFLSDDSVNHILSRNQLALDLMLFEHAKQEPELSYIFIIDKSQQALSHTFSGGFPTGFRELNSSGQQGGQNIPTTRQIRFGEQDIIDISVPVMEGRLGHLHAGMSLRGIETEIAGILFRVSILITIFVVASGVVLWAYLGRVALAPIKRLGERVRLIGQGKFETRISVNSADEIGMLGKEFNEMGGKLEELYLQMSERSAELVHLNAQLEQLATTDGLTGLYNHRHFYSRLAEEVQRAKRYQHSLSMIMADIDEFKKFNDTFGHLTGDSVLRIIAGLVSENARENDLVARYGGEELAIILPETDLATTRLVAERMRRVIESSPELIKLSGKPVTVSFGLAELDEATDTPVAFVQMADIMLYRAKEKGRNRVEC